MAHPTLYSLVAAQAVRVVVVVCVCLVPLGTVLGCSTLAETILAPRSEYDAYRQVRTSRTVRERLQASHAYIDRYPNGRWRQEVGPWFDRAEAKFYARREDTPEGLTDYLDALPLGPHSSEARQRLARHRVRQQQAKREGLSELAQQTEERLAQMARGREQAREAFSQWIGQILSIHSWGETTSYLDSEFIFAWRIDKPKGRCEEDRCSKVVQLPYELPGGEAGRREMVLEVVLTLKQGELQEVTVQGPGLFSRLYEASKIVPVGPDDGQARVQAISFTADFVAGAAESVLPTRRCAKEAVAPIVLKRECDGWQLDVVAADHLGDDDAIIVRGPTRAM